MEKEISNGKFIPKFYESISPLETKVVIDSVKKNIPVSSVEGVYAEDDDWAGGKATIVHIPIRYVMGTGHDRYKNTVQLLQVPEIQIVITDATGYKNENDKSWQYQHECLIIFLGCRVRPYRHRNWEEYTNRNHYGYKFTIEDLVTYDILPCLRTFSADFKDLLDPINSDITNL